MKAHQIKAKLLLAERPPQRIAEELGVGRSVVSHVIHGRKSSRRVANEIAKAINMPAAAIWPGQYGVKIVRAAAAGRAVKRASRAVGR